MNVISVNAMVIFVISRHTDGDRVNEGDYYAKIRLHKNSRKTALALITLI